MESNISIREIILSRRISIFIYHVLINVLSQSQAFTQNQVKILEYLEDLKYYYKTGYGLDINTKIGCPPIKDMIEKFTKKIDTNGK